MGGNITYADVACFKNMSGEQLCVRACQGMPAVIFVKCAAVVCSSGAPPALALPSPRIPATTLRPAHHHVWAPHNQPATHDAHFRFGGRQHGRRPHDRAGRLPCHQGAPQSCGRGGGGQGLLRQVGGGPRSMPPSLPAPAPASSIPPALPACLLNSGSPAYNGILALPMAIAASDVFSFLSFPT